MVQAFQYNIEVKSNECLLEIYVAGDGEIGDVSPAGVEVFIEFIEAFEFQPDLVLVLE